MASAQADRAAATRQLVEERAAHDKALSDERAAASDELQRRTAELDLREAKLIELSAATEKDRADAARLRADLDRRLKLITEPA